MNQAMLSGNLGSDPEINYLSDGTAVANVSLATSEKWKDKEGSLKEETQWHRLTFWKSRAETVKKYLTKGDQLTVIGKIQYKEYEKDGVKKYATNIIVEKFKFHSSKKEGANTGNNDGGDPGVSDDDLPF